MEIYKPYFSIKLWKFIYLMPCRVTIGTSLSIFQYKILNDVFYFNENIFQFKSFPQLFVLFVIRKMKPRYTFFTLAIKQNLFGLNSKNYLTQKYFFDKIRHRVLSLVFQIIKETLKSLTICILWLSIICLNLGIQSLVELKKI